MSFAYCLECDTSTKHDEDGRCFECGQMLCRGPITPKDPQITNDAFAQYMAECRRVVAETPLWKPQPRFRKGR